MTEPVSTVSTGIVINIMTIGFAGTVFGMRYDLLLIGMVGVLLSLCMQERKERRIAFSLVSISTIFSGALAPVSGALLAKWLDLPSSVEDLRIGSAAVIGFGWQSIAPAVWNLVSQKISGRDAS